MTHNGELVRHVRGVDDFPTEQADDFAILVGLGHDGTRRRITLAGIAVSVRLVALALHDTIIRPLSKSDLYRTNRTARNDGGGADD